MNRDCFSQWFYLLAWLAVSVIKPLSKHFLDGEELPYRATKKMSKEYFKPEFDYALEIQISLKSQ